MTNLVEDVPDKVTHFVAFGDYIALYSEQDLGYLAADSTRYVSRCGHLRYRKCFLSEIPSGYQYLYCRPLVHSCGEIILDRQAAL